LRFGYIRQFPMYLGYLQSNLALNRDAKKHRTSLVRRARRALAPRYTHWKPTHCARTLSGARLYWQTAFVVDKKGDI